MRRMMPRPRPYRDVQKTPRDRLETETTTLEGDADSDTTRTKHI